MFVADFVDKGNLHFLAVEIAIKVQEMNFNTALRAVGTFTYRAQSENGLIEHELDHVLIGEFNDPLPEPNPAEADAARWITLEALDRELAQHPEQFTPWFALGLAIARKHV